MKTRITIILLVAMLTACGTSRTAIESHERERVDTIAVSSLQADRLETGERQWERIREVVVMQADSTGRLRETSRIVTTEIEREHNSQKIAENALKIDSAAFLRENDISYKESKKKPAEGRKTGFAFFLGVAVVAVAVIVVSLLKFRTR